MKRLVTLFVAAALTLTFVPGLIADDGVVMEKPRPLQQKTGAYPNGSQIAVFAEDIDVIYHPGNGQQNFTMDPVTTVTIDGKDYNVADFVMTPGFKIGQVNKDFFLPNITVAGEGAASINFDLANAHAKNIYIADVRNENTGENEKALVPPVIFIDDNLNPYDSIHPQLPTDTTAFSMTRFQGSDDIALVTYDLVVYTTVDDKPMVIKSPVFYLRKNAAGLYRLAGVLGKPAPVAPGSYYNQNAIDIESLDINNDGNEDFAVVSRLGAHSYVLFFLRQEGAWLDDIENNFKWPTSWGTGFIDSFDSAVVSDKLAHEGQEPIWHDSLIVPSFDKAGGQYKALKFTTVLPNIVAKQEIGLGVPNFVANVCKKPEDKCGPVRIKCTRYIKDSTAGIFDLNNDGCGDCVITWARLIDTDPDNPYFQLFPYFSTYIFGPKNGGGCELKDTNHKIIDYLLPADNMEVVGGAQPAMAFAVEISNANPLVDPFLDIWIGDQQLYERKSEEALPKLEQKRDAFVYLFKGKIFDDGNWDIIDAQAIQSEAVWPAAYDTTSYVADLFKRGGGVKAIVSDKFGNLGIINGYPFIPIPDKEIMVCPSGKDLICEEAKYQYDYPFAPEIKNEDGDCIPDCIEGPGGLQFLMCDLTDNLTGQPFLPNHCQHMMDDACTEDKFPKLCEYDGATEVTWKDYQDIMFGDNDQDKDCMPDCFSHAADPKPIDSYKLCDKDISVNQGFQIDWECKTGGTPCPANVEGLYTFIWIFPDSDIVVGQDGNGEDIYQQYDNDSNKNSIPDCIYDTNTKQFQGFCDKDYQDAGGQCPPPLINELFKKDKDAFFALLSFLSDIFVRDAAAVNIATKSEATVLINRSAAEVLQPQPGVEVDVCDYEDGKEPANIKVPEAGLQEYLALHPEDKQGLCIVVPPGSVIVCHIVAGQEPAPIVVSAAELDEHLANNPSDKVGACPMGQKVVLPISTLDIDRPYMDESGRMIDPIEEGGAESFKAVRLKNLAFNDWFRATTGIKVDVVAVEFVSRISANMVIPAVIAEDVELGSKAAAGIIPFGLKAGERPLNWQAIRTRPNWNEAVLTRPLVMYNSDLVKSSQGLKTVSGEADFLPSDAVKIKESDLVVNDVFRLQFGAVKTENSISQSIGSGKAFHAPYVISWVTRAGLDGCGWAIGSCHTAVGPANQRGLSYVQLMKDTEQLVADKKAKGIPIDASIVKELREMNRWDKLGLMENTYSVDFVPSSSTGPKAIMTKDSLSATFTALADANLDPAIVQKVEEMVASGQKEGHFAPEFYVNTLPWYAAGVEQRGAGCHCSFTGSGPSKADLVYLLLVATFIAVLRMRRNRVG